MGVLSQDLFTMIVTMAVLTTLAMPPSLRWALARLPMREEERQRIEREEFEAKGFMPNVERLLLAVDDSPNGKFMAHLTGLLAGRRGTPTTLVRMRNPEPTPQAEDHGPEADLKAGAETARDAHDAEQALSEAAAQEEMTGKAEPAEKDNGEKKAPKASTREVSVTRAESKTEGPEEIVARESRKGYDLMMVGVDETVGPDGALHEDVARIVGAFEGPLGVAIARGSHRDDPARRLKILVPVSGNNVSRRAAEVAVMLARAQDVPITFLYVASGKRAGGRRSGTLHQHEQAALKELVTWAERYDTQARVAVHTEMAPQEAILREIKQHHYDLVVMGVNRRPGEALFFGNVAGAVIEDAEASVLLLSS
jgi:nucleotide-binding universal stress UspA family protein